jgi:hypothetical protein
MQRRNDGKGSNVTAVIDKVCLEGAKRQEGGSRRGAKARDGIRERAWAYRTSGCAR